jgi:hypothetical protein
MMIPFNNIVEEYINDYLKRNDNKGEKEIIDEVLDLDFILFSNCCLIIENPKKTSEKWL